MRKDVYWSFLELKRDIRKNSLKEYGLLQPNKIKELLVEADNIFKEKKSNKTNGDEKMNENKITIHREKLPQIRISDWAINEVGMLWGTDIESGQKVGIPLTAIIEIRIL